MTSLSQTLVILLLILGNAGTASAQEAKEKPLPRLAGSFMLRTNDVLAFLGGADVAAAQQSGHLEALLAVAFHHFRLHFRNFGWEGSTVLERQPRDVGFPTQSAQLRRAGASVIFLQYGRAEVIDGSKGLGDFRAGYERLIEECAQSPRLVLVTPPPFEKGAGLLPDLSARNKDLAACAGVIRELARSRHLGLVDLFKELGDGGKATLTENGVQLTPRGHAIVARAFLRQLGYGSLAERASDVNEDGAWSNAGFERVRQSVVAKNRLWFNYWRPQNWAFLGGDRTTQPSSRDHQNPAIRWFPEEMERFVPLIQQAEVRINEAAHAVAK